MTNCKDALEYYSRKKKEAEKMELKEALKVVKENGYIVLKPTKGQLEDMKKCDGDSDCLECRCSICLAQE